MFRIMATKIISHLFFLSDLPPLCLNNIWEIFFDHHTQELIGDHAGLEEDTFYLKATQVHGLALIHPA